MKRQSQQGVALVITLILLSVITFMAVTFLVVSRKEAASVSTLTQQANAKYASEAGLEEAKAQLIAQMLISTNGLNFGLLVSTNFRSGTNFAPGNPSLTNVTYDGVTGGNIPQLMNNLLILPRAPVFIVTNKAFPNNQDFRFYLDLNRNGRYDTNGLVLNLDSNNVPLPSAANPSFSVQIGDPEWIGILNHPDQRHSSSNQFVARYCFIALPIGNSLDVNFIHNQAEAVNAMTTPVQDGGYLRNQGVGSWEINLAGFLNALNTNSWPTSDYSYSGMSANSGFPQANLGIAFNDAAAIMQYRYNQSYANLNKFTDVFGPTASPNAVPQFGNDFIDGFATGPVQTNTFPLTSDRDLNLMNGSKFWSGANNPNAFFTTQDFYGPIPPLTGGISTFTNHLRAPGLSRATYDRYTFYRMLAQMSFGSAPESSVAANPNVISPLVYFPFTNRMNLNYASIGTTNATNFQAWQPVQFFTNAANRLLANAGYTNTVSNIPIYPTNFYTPALHRLLQLAANIYDASTTNRPFDNLPTSTNVFYPSVFRPLFGTRVINGIQNVFISGYTNDPPDLTATAAYNNIPFGLPEDLNTIVTTIGSGTGPDPKLNIYGIPWVIGAKKGFPNFNEFSMASVSQISRKLQVVYKSQTNVQYTIGISNVLGVEAWNSYASTYSRDVKIFGAATMLIGLSNQLGEVLLSSNLTLGRSLFYGKSTPILIPANTWVGFSHPTLPGTDSNSFKIPLFTNVLFLPDSAYHPNGIPRLTVGGTNFDVTGPNATVPEFVLTYTNRLQFVMLDSATGRVIDYVSFGGLNFARDLTAELQGNDGGGHGGVWLTNLAGGLPLGINHQLQISLGNPVIGFTSPDDWNRDQVQPTSISSAQTQFAAFLNGQGTGPSMQAPFSPGRKVAVIYTWQANDPLVHYTLGDLTMSPNIGNTIVTNYVLPAFNTNQYLPNIGQVNLRYLPWGNTGNSKSRSVDPTNQFNIAVKDSLIANSDAWQFPTNKFPNVGWLGRVHRGTPWQTVYLKSQPVDLVNWQNWTGHTMTNQFGTTFNNGFVYGPNFVEAGLSMPTNDWSILDLFTTSPNDNASHGQLSVNQTNLAAWAAILDGVITVSNSPVGPVPVVIDPRTNNNAILQIVNGINATRNTVASFPGQVFTSVGQILATPQLTVASPYINTANSSTLSDAVYERIPQQILSLLRVGSPRYVIFAYGQSLKPADHSIVQSSGPFFGICTNYAITGEVATRTVLRIDNPPIPNRAATTPRAVVESFNVLPPE